MENIEEIIKEFRRKFCPYIVEGGATKDDLVAKEVNEHDGDWEEYEPFTCGEIEDFWISRLK